MRPVAEFVEKPDAARAKAFVASGDYFWNSGMFLLPAQGYLDELGRQDPAMLAACRKAFEAAATDQDFVRLDKAAFEACRADSIDYAVMEKTDLAAVVPLSAGWSDVGSFAALQDALDAGCQRQRHARRRRRRGRKGLPAVSRPIAWSPRWASTGTW